MKMSEATASDLFEIEAIRQDKQKLLNELEKIQQQNLALSRQLADLESEMFSLEQDINLWSGGHNDSQSCFYQLLFEQSNQPLVLIDTHGRILKINDEAVDFLDVPSALIEDKTQSKIQDYLDYGSKKALTKILLNAKETYSPELVLSNSEGELFTPHVKFLTLDAEPLPKKCVLLTLYPMNYTDYSSQMMRLHILAIDQIKEGVIITDQNQKIIRVNQGFCEITGYTVEEALGQTPAILSSGRQSQRYYDQMWEHIRKHGWWEGEIWNKTKGGEVYPEWLQITRIWDDLSKHLFYIAIFSDITGRKEEQHKLDRLAFFDQLTGLPNRESLQNFTDNLIFRSQENNHSFAMLFLDLDKFKEVNDRFGHGEGDIVLQEATQRIVASIRDSDFAARVGGDEFVIILSHIKSIKNAETVSRNLISALCKPFEISENKHFLSASIGVSMFPDHANSQEELLRKADLAMYRSKESGRNQFTFYEQSIDDDTAHFSSIQNFIRDSIDHFEENIVVHYQPLCHPLAVDDCFEYECLVRLQRNGELIYPDQFIEASEHSGLIVEFGLAIFKKICADVVKHKMQNAKFAVNLSAKQFDSLSLFQSLQDTANAYGLELNQFNFEVTETAVTLNLGQMERVLHELRNRGCTILLDDFGTGYASLSMLKNLPVDIVKIDRSFIIDLGETSTNEMVSAMIFMAKALNLKVVCEGVETQEQLDWLHELGVDYIQGYLISKPKPLAAFCH
ncbi:EAL domain-containing protein [Thiomicrorhabdus indica]|uniref:sensor domain-containing protein n=1 Tax=Thiomicrorhabdus indica TaxID=2267253 RepID=UPI002AA66E6C|nr:EAL domain-containing protein [Thiomicrorhabdus indica]